ncbi:hypothetical protein L226DRAFT_386009 [Lentinus tigrinus ALCF2SS1-7]|uniref:uncharacterized protein n=1 Tax=Lentinus tigrinus ALCF2SS1-7 TaxID=1328758 RepID=UPI0011660AC4|nr:hypothetical protein L226DRAFT_386009 [Lentinus tigrinus ALCF2SS1-7]
MRTGYNVRVHTSHSTSPRLFLSAILRLASLHQRASSFNRPVRILSSISPRCPLGVPRRLLASASASGPRGGQYLSVGLYLK